MHVESKLKLVPFNKIEIQASSALGFDANSDTFTGVFKAFTVNLVKFAASSFVMTKPTFFLPTTGYNLP